MSGGEATSRGEAPVPPHVTLPAPACVTARMAARTLPTAGEVNTAPATTPVSIPFPMYPAEGTRGLRDLLGPPAHGGGDGGLTCVCGLMARAPPGDQGHPSPDGGQVGAKEHAVSPQQPQPGVTGHQPRQRVIRTARRRVHQLLGDLVAQRGGGGGGRGGTPIPEWVEGQQGGPHRPVSPPCG